MKVIHLVNNISITSIPSRWSFFINQEIKGIESLIIQLKKISSVFFLNKKDSVVHGHHVKSMSIFLFLNLFINLKSIYTVHGSYLYLSRINKFLFNFIVSRTDYIVFVNTTLYEQLPQHIKIKIVDKFEIIFNGVEDKYNFDFIDVVNKFNLNKKNKFIFHPARFVKEKNHINLIKSFKLALKEDNNLVLLLAGDGKLKSKIKSKINELNLEDKVLILGLISKDEVFNFYNLSEVFVMPSISEGLNVSFLEAISMNCKIVTSNIKQFTQPVDSSNFSFKELNIEIADPNDIFSISNKILHSLKTKKNILHENPFSIKKMINEYISIYNKLK